MTDLNLSEGQEFFIGGQRYIVKDGAPVQQANRGPLGGELVRFDSLKALDRFTITLEKTNEDFARCISPVFDMCCGSAGCQEGKIKCVFVEVNTLQQAKGRVMTAGEAASLPDIVGKRVMVEGRVVLIDADSDKYKLSVAWESGYAHWFCGNDKIEVLS